MNQIFFVAGVGLVAAGVIFPPSRWTGVLVIVGLVLVLLGLWLSPCAKCEPMDVGVRRIHEERLRQIGKGFDAGHDDGHVNAEILSAAICYARHADCIIQGSERSRFDAVEHCYPWQTCWNPDPDPIRNLEKAGALIAAEIGRLERLGQRRSECSAGARNTTRGARVVPGNGGAA